MERITGSAVSEDLYGAGKDGFKNGDKANGISATVVTAEFLNQVQEEIANVIEGVGDTLNPADRTQLYQAIGKMIAGIDINARFTTTANITLSGLGTAAGRDWSSAVTAGDIILVKNQSTASQNGWYVAAAGAWTRVTYLDNATEVKPSNLTKVSEGTTLADSIWMLTTDAPIVVGTTALTFVQKDAVDVPDASTTVKGIVELATDGEAQALSSALLALTPSTLNTALKGANQSLSTNGYQKLPGGLILQWAVVGSIGSNSNSSFPFPISFPNSVLAVFTSRKSSNSDGVRYPMSWLATSTTLTLYGDDYGADNANYFAIGY